MEKINLVIICILLFAIELIYFRIADKYNIIDKPNERSSHAQVTLRGGGIIFPIAAILSGVFFQQPGWLLLAGIIIISIVSFIDDVQTLNNRIRIIFHLAAVALLIYGAGLLNVEWYRILIAVVLIIGTINAYNFMDGINGITGCYTLAILFSLVCYNMQKPEIAPRFVDTMIPACLVFLFFNFRKKAKCFAGDVGSVSLGFIVCALIIAIIIQENSLKYIFFLSVYGVDAVLTIIHRLMLRQNIFEAHRLHYYQVLANNRKISHRLISAGYAAVQLATNIFIINTGFGFVVTGLIVCSPLAALYLFTKKKLMLPGTQ